MFGLAKSSVITIDETFSQPLVPVPITSYTPAELTDMIFDVPKELPQT